MADLFHSLYTGILLALFGIPLFLIYTLRNEIEGLIRGGVHRFVESRRKAALKAKAEAGPDAKPEEVEKKMGLVTRIIHRVSGDAVEGSSELEARSSKTKGRKSKVEGRTMQITGDRGGSGPAVVPQGGTTARQAEPGQTEPARQEGTVPKKKMLFGAESMEAKVLPLLKEKPLSKAEIAAGLGHHSVSGTLKHVIADLLARGVIAYTQPESPRSNSQKYRLVEGQKPGEDGEDRKK